MATIRALKYNGGVAKGDLNAENLEALEKGIANLEKHIENIHKYNVPVSSHFRKCGKKAVKAV